ncbi:glycosyltransferase [Gordonia sp. NPDC003422]
MGGGLSILQVVTLVTPDGAFGGPTRVAINQACALRDLGHEVTIVASGSGYQEFPAKIEGVDVKLFKAQRLVPGVGFAGLWAKGMRHWLFQHRQSFDVAHVHLARDLVTVPALTALRKLGCPYVVQTHGMIVANSHPLAQPIDRFWIRDLLRGAGTVYALNSREVDDLGLVVDSVENVRLLRNGVPIPEVQEPDAFSNSHSDASAETDRVPEVLFMARLHERKRPVAFARAALALLNNGVRAHFTIAGPPGGVEDAVDEVIAQARSEGFTDEQIRREGGVDPESVSARMANCAVYVLPAVREPFGMTVLEALAVGRPVIIGADGGLSDFVDRNGCGLLVPDVESSLVSAIEELLRDPAARQQMGQRGKCAVAAEYGMNQIAEELLDGYSKVTTGGGGR